MYFEIYPERASIFSPATGWRWRLKGANHKILASGESYINKADCLHVIGLIKAANAMTPVNEVIA